MRSNKISGKFLFRTLAFILIFPNQIRSSLISYLFYNFSFLNNCSNNEIRTFEFRGSDDPIFIMEYSSPPELIRDLCMPD
ncbi:hypothetical protein LEP1GSC185_0477 [Leptospira licerasiae serovar Varillal str. VAR 010]|nr:hypothetical protein LEP1GSC185_0477 [Leptospira licerasiae serovar Varillal str. VAR 010]